MSGVMASADPVLKHLTCCICLEIYNVPKTLPCLHSFCESCLTGHILKTELIHSEKGEYFECPLCRAKTYVLKDVPKMQWANFFPTNHGIVSLLNESIAPHKLETATDIECMPCKTDEKQKKACCFCIQCMEYYCKCCYDGHRKYKAFQQHTVLTGNEIPGDISAFERMTKLKFCVIHPQKEVEFKCVNDGKYICSICAATTHRSCGNITHIQNDDEDRMSDVRQFINDVKLMRSDVEKSLESKLKVADELDKVATNAEQNVTTLFEKLNAFVMKMRQEFLADYAEKLGLERQMLSPDLKECFDLIENINQLICVANTVIKYGSKSQIALINIDLRDEYCKLKAGRSIESDLPLYDYVDKLRNYAEQLLNHFIEENLPEQIKPILTGRKSDEPSFKYSMGSSTKKKQEIDPGAIEITNATQHINSVVGKHSGPCLSNQESLASLIGNRQTNFSNDPSVYAFKLSGLETKHEPQNKSDSLPNCHLDASSSTQSEEQSHSFQSGTYSLLKMKVHKVAEHNISVRKCFSTGSHTGSVLLRDGKIAFIDRTNKLLKVTSPDFKVACHSVLNGTPLDLCSCNESNVAVAFDKSIVVIEIDDINATPINYFSTKNTIRSICQVGVNLAILFDESPSENNNCLIQFRSSSNQILKTIDSYKNLGKEVEKLSNAELIRSRSEEELLVCTRNPYKQIICLDKNWCVRWYLKHPSFKIANNLALDRVGNKYVCDTDSGVFIRISAQSFKISRLVIEALLENPASVLSNDKDKTLIIGCLNDDKVYLFRFC